MGFARTILSWLGPTYLLGPFRGAGPQGVSLGTLSPRYRRPTGGQLGHLVPSLQETHRGSAWAPCPLARGDLQGSVLRPHLFSVYTRSPDLVTRSPDLVIKSPSFSNHCCADYIHLFLSFPPSASQVKQRLTCPHGSRPRTWNWSLTRWSYFHPCQVIPSKKAHHHYLNLCGRLEMRNCSCYTVQCYIEVQMLLLDCHWVYFC